MKSKPLTFICLLIGFLTFGQTDSVEISLQRYKDLYTKGLITQQDYDKLRKKELGIDESTSHQPTIEKEVVLIRQELIDTFNMTAQQLYDSGYVAARKNFKTGGVFGGTFATTVLGSPILGLIPAIACSSSPPKEINFVAPNPMMLKNPSFKMGYVEGARREKVKSAWIAWGTGLLLDAMIGTVTGIVLTQTRNR